MSLKYLIFFLSICLITLFSLDAIADGPSSALKKAKTEEEPDKGQNKKAEAKEHTAQNQDQVSLKDCNTIEKAKSLPEEDKKEVETISKPGVDNSNFSFNFIYYILYKFKYIDIFDLPGTGTPNKTGKQETISWH